jgi:radical SAM family uncharacterized protein/radical SAM-linked protein
MLAAERDESFPIVIGGGPCAMNPEPVADFFDAFLLGDGEEAVVEIAGAWREWKRDSLPKSDLLHRLSLIEGVYVPSFFEISYSRDNRISRIEPLVEGYDKIRRRVVEDLDQVPYPTAPLIPFLKTVHDRVSMEIARGCTAGCRFCQAGYIYRPVRERSPQNVLRTIEETLRNSGYDEVSLLSLSAADYGCINPLMKALMERFSRERVAVSFPSLRVGTLTQDLVEEVRKVRKTGFTLAPEAGSDRLRRVINKGIEEEDLLVNAGQIYGAGWRLIKLYFMIGLPTESAEDVLGIAELARKVKLAGKRTGSGGDVNVSVGNFVPKAHTPFQWEPQIAYEEILRKQEILRFELKRKKLHFKWQDAPLSVLEGVFARGDRRLGRVLLKARELGCRFDSWGEHFSFRRWQTAFDAAGIDPLHYHRRRGIDEILPWDHLDCGVSKEFLLDELKKSAEESGTEDCRGGTCTGCGLCDFHRIKPVTHDPADFTLPPSSHSAEDETEPERVRLKFSKIGRMRLLSHLEMLNLFIRAVRRGGIPIRHSGGFHPHPKFSFATALSVGVESTAEYFDMEIARGYGADRVRQALNTSLPQGVEILEAFSVPLRSPSLSTIIESVKYRVTLPEGMETLLSRKAEAFLSLDSLMIRREKQGRVVEIDLRKELRELIVTGRVLAITVGRGKPVEYASAISGLPESELKSCRIEKTAVVFAA